MSAHPAAPLPIARFADWSGRDPSIIYFSGDSGNIVSRLSWSWTATQAVGHGTRGFNDCEPNCAEGHVTFAPETVTLSDPAGGQFTQGVEQDSGAGGMTMHFTLPSPYIDAS